MDEEQKETERLREGADGAQEANGSDESPPPGLEEELAAAKDQLLRAHAEMENLRKRAAREIEKSRAAAIELFARDMLGILDDIRRAEILLKEREIDSALREGIELIFASAERMLARHQIRRIEALGEIFDPNFHEALFEDSASEAEAGRITQVIEEGYMLGDRLLRAARVAVAAAAARGEEKGAPTGGADEEKLEQKEKKDGDIL